MRSKFSIMLVCCALGLAVSVLSILGAQAAKAKLGKVSLKLPLIKKIAVPRQILTFSTKEGLQLLLQRRQAYPETHVATSGVAAANADISTNRVWAVVLRDGLAPVDVACVGFKTNGLQNTGSTGLHGVTVTVTANILEVQQPRTDVYLAVGIYKDGSVVGDWKGQSIGEVGNYNLTSGSFTMDPGHNYCALGLIYCRSSVKNQATTLVAEIANITWKI